MIGVESASLYSKSTHFDSALAADLHEKSLGIFSSHAGANAGAGLLSEHKSNLQQDDWKQYKKCRQNLAGAKKNDKIAKLLKI